MRCFDYIGVSMSEDIEAVEIKSCCASCGIAEIDDIELKECDDCDLVKYCSDGCEKEHKSEHEESCKKRAAELRDELLFKQPEGTHNGDCPICCLPLSLDNSKSIMSNCCSKVVCNGCTHVNNIREIEARLTQKCPFCRKPSNITEEMMEKRRMKRVKANDTGAMCQEAVEQYEKGDYMKAFEYWTKAAELGDAWAHYNLALLYQRGEGVEKSRSKKIHHLEEAAIGGHPKARYNLGCDEWHNGNTERAVKHFIISATQGFDNSMNALVDAYKMGEVSKDELTTALRAHQAAVDATKSPQRDAAEKFMNRIKR